jgi:iron uptake system component EfeO
MPARPALLALTPLALSTLVMLTACSGGSVKQTVDVTVAGETCDLSSTTLDAGKTAFEVKNTSGEEAEAYVYTADGDKVDEVEGIADGVSRTLTVSLDAGDYEFACKPEGDDVRTSFTVS